MSSLRPLDGDKNGDARPDIGCCEFNPDQVGDVSAKLLPDRTEIAVGEQIGFTLVLDGFDAEGVTAVWEIVPGEPSAPVPAVAGLTNVTMAVCLNQQSVKVTVADASGHMAMASSVPVTVRPRETFVAKDGSETWPYDTPEKATKNLWTAAETALAPAGQKKTVTVLPGTYDLGWTFDVPSACVLRGRGELGSVVLTYSAAANQGVLKIVAADSVVTNLAIRGGRGNGTNADKTDAASGVLMTAGLLTGCEISGCKPARDGYGTQALVLKGSNSATCPVARNCIISNNLGKTNGTDNYSRGAAVFFGQWGKMYDTEITANTGTQGGVVMVGHKNNGGAMLCDCYVHDNHGTSTGGAVLSFGGIIERCRIVRNTCDGDTGGIYVDSGTLINCTIAGNHGGASVAGLSTGGANCYIYDTICWGNEPDPDLHEQYAPTSALETSINAATTVDGLIAREVDPNGSELWRNVRPVDARLWRGTYEPKGSSPAVNAGSRTRWESFAPGVTTDLAGKRRVRSGAIDLGAFEYHGDGLAVVVR